jgi:hypothetical protein
MPLLSGQFSRDANYVPITTDGITSSKSQTLSGSSATVSTPLFRITGSIEIRALYGVITTDLGANHTAAFWRLNDQTAQIALTLATGTTLSAKKAGSVIAKKGLVGAALSLLDNVAGAVSEPTTLETAYFSPFVVVKKTAANTDIEYTYTTTDAPTSGVIQHFIRWLPLSADANVTVQ